MLGDVLDGAGFDEDDLYELGRLSDRQAAIEHGSLHSAPRISPTLFYTT